MKPLVRLVMTAGVVAIALSGCARLPTDAPAEPGPTAACPYVEGAPADPGCAYYDPDAAMAQNSRYKERFAIDADTQARGDALVPRLTAALEPFVSGGAVITRDAVLQAIVDLGVDEHAVQLTGEPPATVGVAFGISIDGGCVFGGVSERGVEADVGGGIMDGGCLAMSGH